MPPTSDHVFKVAPMVDTDGISGPAYNDEDASFYCVYTLFDNGNIEPVSDFDTRKEAEDFANRLNEELVWKPKPTT